MLLMFQEDKIGRRKAGFCFKNFAFFACFAKADFSVLACRVFSVLNDRHCTMLSAIFMSSEGGDFIATVIA